MDWKRLLNYLPILVTVRQYIGKFVEMYWVAVWLSLACLKASFKVWTFLLHYLLCSVLYCMNKNTMCLVDIGGNIVGGSWILAGMR